MSLIPGKLYSTTVHLAANHYHVDFRPRLEHDEDDTSFIEIVIEVVDIEDGRTGKEVAFSTFDPQDKKEIEYQCQKSLPKR